MTAPLGPADAPTGELGQPGNIRAQWGWARDKAWEPKPAETNPELQFPRSVKVFDQMRRTDGQIGKVLRACTLPILDAGWDLDGSGCRAEVVNFVRAELGITEPGKPKAKRRRGESGIVWRDHLREALGCLAQGFMPFEQVYTITLPGQPGHPDGVERPIVHLKKLAQRLPSTVSGFVLAADGGLMGINQAAPEGDFAKWVSNSNGLLGGTVLPVDRLVVYVNEREGADWAGQSILRPAYKHWLIKDQLIRLDAQAAERNSMGVPVVYYSNEMSKADALEIARGFRAGSQAGVAIAEGSARIELVAVSGSTRDVLPSIAYHDQAISGSVVAMFLDLGHDTGARSLGETFLDFFLRSVRSVALQLAETATEHVVRDLVEWNWGPDEAYPSLTPGEIAVDGQLAPEQLKALVDAKVLTADLSLEEHIRDRFRLPEKDEEPDPVAPVVPMPGLVPVPDPAGPATDPAADPAAEPAPTGPPANPFVTAASTRAQYAASLAARAAALES